MECQSLDSDRCYLHFESCSEVFISGTEVAFFAHWQRKYNTRLNIWTPWIKYFNKREMKIKLIYFHSCYHKSECFLFLSRAAFMHIGYRSLNVGHWTYRSAGNQVQTPLPDSTLFSTAATVHGHNHNFISRQKAALQINYSALPKHALQ